MDKKLNWYELSKKYNGLEYNYGSWQPEKGLDCLSMILTFLKDTGIDITVFEKMEYTYKNKKVTMFNYHKILDDIKEGSSALKCFIRDRFTEVGTLKKGNIIFYTVDQDEAVGIYLGNNLMLITFAEFGLKIIKIDIKKIEGAYICQQF
jgi:cell wall-associated NlpC family hydrolase